MYNFTESLILQLPEVTDKSHVFTESEGVSDGNKLIVEIAAIHAGMTSNFTVYTEENLKESVGTWVSPYPKPIIVNHDEYSDPLGRVMAAKMDAEEDGTPYIALQVALPSKEAASRVLDERYITGSVGGRASTALCTICGTDWAKPKETAGMPCKHRRGNMYDGKVAGLELGGINWVEYSFVNIPADKKSRLKKTYSQQDEINQEGWIQAVKVYSLDMSKESVIDLENDQNILESFTESEASYIYKNLVGTFLTTEAYNEKFTFINNDNTIKEEINIDALEENTSMSTKGTEAIETEEDDILTVAEGLRSESVTEESEETENTDLSEQEDNAEESAESSDQETDSATESEETAEAEATDEGETESEDTAEEAEETQEANETEDQDLVGSEEEADADTADAVSETSENVDPSLAESLATIEALRSEIETLKQKNDRLRENLHYMLAERVVDAKINAGIVDASERVEALKEHEARTAASLADALRDITAIKNVVRPASASKESLMDVHSHALEEDNAVTEGEADKEENKLSDKDKYILTLSEGLLGRLSL